MQNHVSKNSATTLSAMLIFLLLLGQILPILSHRPSHPQTLGLLVDDLLIFRLEGFVSFVLFYLPFLLMVCTMSPR